MGKAVNLTNQLFHNLSPLKPSQSCRDGTGHKEVFTAKDKFMVASYTQMLEKKLSNKVLRHTHQRIEFPTNALYNGGLQHCVAAPESGLLTPVAAKGVGTHETPPGQMASRQLLAWRGDPDWEIQPSTPEDQFTNIVTQIHWTRWELLTRKDFIHQVRPRLSSHPGRITTVQRIIIIE